MEIWEIAATERATLLRARSRGWDRKHRDRTPPWWMRPPPRTTTCTCA